MQTMKLTDAAVRRLRAPAGWTVDYFDADLPGFGLHVDGPGDRNPGGRKSWVLLYRLGEDQKRLTLTQPYPVLGLEEARREAATLLRMAESGIDPARAEPVVTPVSFGRRSNTVGSIIDAFLARGVEAPRGRVRAASTIETVRSNFENHVLPRWRERDVTAITCRDVLALRDAIAARRPVPGWALGAKKRRPSGGPAAAERVLASLRTLFDWAKQTGLVDLNPCV